MATTMPPTQIMRCDCVSLLAFITATMTQADCRERADYNEGEDHPERGSRPRYRFVSDARMDWTVTTPLRAAP